MSTHNDWLNTNITDRLTAKGTDFRCQLSLYPFERMEFHDACSMTAKLIAAKHPKLYLSLSNGIDSEYVLKCFLKNGIHITPIIVLPAEQRAEFDITLSMCDELGITPVIISVTHTDVIKRFYQSIVEPICGYGINSTYNLFAADYARENFGFLVTGDHLLGDDSETVQMIEAAEWDFYLDVTHGTGSYCPFFTYTVETIYAMTYEMDATTSDDFRHRLYGLDFRPKFKYIYDCKYDEIFVKIRKSRPAKPNPVHLLGDRNDFLNILKKWRTA